MLPSGARASDGDDCRKNSRDRPQALRYADGATRQKIRVRQRSECKNRDSAAACHSACFS